jgi:hypothetical protein
MEIKHNKSGMLTESIQDSQLEKKWNALMFGVRRSIRYHLHRRKFFERLGTWTNFLLIISGSTVIGLASKYGTTDNLSIVVVGAIIAILSSIDLVVGFSNKARDYHDLVKDFSGLEMEMTKCKSITQESLSEFTNKRLAIEENEPPTLLVLDMHCHNELCLAMGVSKSELYDIGLIRYICMDYFDINPNGVENFKELSNPSVKPAAINPSAS